jgi:hypothetical protein
LGAGLERAIGNCWLALDESGTFVKFTEAGAALLLSCDRGTTAGRKARRLNLPYVCIRR